MKFKKKPVHRIKKYNEYSFNTNLIIESKIKPVFQENDLKLYQIKENDGAVYEKWSKY